MQDLNISLSKTALNFSGRGSRAAGLSVAPPVGLEPTTDWLTASASDKLVTRVSCSTELSYGGMDGVIVAVLRI